MRVSIALAAYNGARFLQEQLDSFAAQTRPPDELVICDDGSSDNTMEIAQGFAATAPFPVSVRRNPANLGYSRNFQRATALCTGDIIFFSDQDDVWFPTKIARIVAELESRPEIQVVINDQVLTNESLEHRGVTKLANLARLNLNSDGLVEGCCTAFRRSFGELVFPLPAEEQQFSAYLSHDVWLNELARWLGVRAVVEQPLQFFRRHQQTTTSWALSEPRQIGFRDLVRTRQNKAPRNAWLARVEVLQLYADWLRLHRTQIETETTGDVGQALAAIEHERRSLEARASLARSTPLHRLIQIWRLWRGGGYAYFNGWKSAFGDAVRGG